MVGKRSNITSHIFILEKITDWRENLLAERAANHFIVLYNLLSYLKVQAALHMAQIASKCPAQSLQNI